MQPSLMQRYVYGNFSPPPEIRPGDDYLYGISARERDLMDLVRAQAALNEVAAAALEQSSLESAEIIRRELRLQAERLRNIAGLPAIDDLGHRVVSEVGELQWELDQLKAGSESPDRQEIRELLPQGVRNLVNDKLEQAEERFLAAYQQDNTHYQVLMNLAAVALRKGDADRAIANVRDALTLPAALDARAKADALWCRARIHYVLGNYKSASEVAALSTSHIPDPRRILGHGMYCLLAGDTPMGLARIEQAIHEKAELFAVTAAAPDIAAHQQDVLALLDRLASHSLHQVRGGVRELELRAAALAGLKRVTRSHFVVFEEARKEIEQLADEPSYSGSREALTKIPLLVEASERMVSLNEAAEALAAAEGAKVKAAETRERAWQRWDRATDDPGCGCWAAGGFFFLTGIMIAKAVDDRWFAHNISPFLGLTLSLSPLTLWALIYFTHQHRRQLARSRELEQTKRTEKDATDRLTAAKKVHQETDRALSQALRQIKRSTSP
jgi:tetratricopeptide (TPR) repeat protein